MSVREVSCCTPSFGHAEILQVYSMRRQVFLKFFCFLDVQNLKSPLVTAHQPSQGYSRLPAKLLDALLPRILLTKSISLGSESGLGNDPPQGIMAILANEQER